MGGYERSTLKLVFDEEQYEGLVIHSKRLSVGALLAISDLQATDWRDTPVGIQAFTDLAGELAKVLTSWNLEEAGTPVPLNAAAIEAQDFEMVLDISRALMRGSAGASRPLPQPSNAGDTSVEASIPMEIPSESPRS